MSELQFTVYGVPGPQGSKKFMGLTKAGRGILVESSKKVKPWRMAVAMAAADVDGCITGPVDLEIVFTLPKPKSAPKKKTIYPDKKPDLSKLIRSTEDAITAAGKWEDDARVVRCTATKVFPGEGVDALDSPGAVIRIRPYGPSTATT